MRAFDAPTSDATIRILLSVANCVDGGQVQATVNGNGLAWIWTLPVNPQPGDTDITTLTRQ